MTRLAILGVPRTGHTLRAAILQARLRGMEVALLDRSPALEQCLTLPAVRQIALDGPDAEAIEALRAFDPRFVVSFSEFYLVRAAEFREQLGLPGLGSEIVRRTRCKYATRLRLSEQGLSRAAFAVTTLAELEETASEFEPPFVIKPASMTGSIGVHAVRARADVAAYRARFVSWDAETARDRRFVVESFLQGDEYSVEGICHGGAFHLVAVTAKHTDGFPNFAETGHIVPARHRPGVDFGGFVARVAAALEFESTPIHAEVKVLGTEIELIEIHTRFAGDLIPLLVEKALGYDLFGAYYDLLLGIAPPPPGPAHAVAGIRFLHADEPGLAALSLRSRPGVDFCVQVDAAGGSGAVHEADNIRILSPRAGHVRFTARDHDEAESFLAELDAIAATTQPGKAA